MNFKLCCLDNVKEPHNSTSVEEYKKIYAWEVIRMREMLIEVQ